MIAARSAAPCVRLACIYCRRSEAAESTRTGGAGEPVGGESWHCRQVARSRASPSANPVGRDGSLAGRRGAGRATARRRGVTPCRRLTSARAVLGSRRSPVRPSGRRPPPPHPRRPAAPVAARRSKIRRALACVTVARAAAPPSRARAAAARPRPAPAPPTPWTSGAPGAADDVASRRSGAEDLVDVRVPLGAATGPVTVMDRDGVESPPPPGPSRSTPAPSPVVDRRRPFDRRRRAGANASSTPPSRRVSYIVRDQPVNVRSSSSGRRRRRDRELDPGPVPPETPQIVQWNGTAGGKVQKDGRYTFRVSATSPPAPSPPRAQAPPGHARQGGPGGFVFTPHLPDPRPARTAPTRPLRRRPRPPGPGRLRRLRHPARRRPRRTVKFKQYHSRAGYYVVVDGEPPATTTPTCTCARPRSSTRATRSAPAS